MARRSKQDHELRKNRSIRYTDAEWEALGKQAAKAGMATGQFAREVSLGARVATAHGPKPADPKLLTKLNALAVQLSGMGNLLNQVMPYAHNNEQIPTCWAEQWVDLPQEIKRAQDEARDLLEAMVKADVR